MLNVFKYWIENYGEDIDADLKVFIKNYFLDAIVAQTNRAMARQLWSCLRQRVIPIGNASVCSNFPVWRLRVSKVEFITHSAS